MSKFSTAERHLIYKKAREIFLEDNTFMCTCIVNAMLQLLDEGLIQNNDALSHLAYPQMIIKLGFIEMEDIAPYGKFVGSAYFGDDTENSFMRLSMFDTIIERTKPKVSYQQSPYGAWKVLTVYGVPINGHWEEDSEKIQITMFYNHNDYDYRGNLLRNNIRKQTPCDMVRDWIHKTYPADKIKSNSGWSTKSQSWTEYTIYKN